MRFVFSALSAASLVLCLAACVFTWRSQSIDECVFFPRKGHASYSFDSRLEGLHFDSNDPWPIDEPTEVISYRRDRPAPDVMVTLCLAPPVEVWNRWGVVVRIGTCCLPLDSNGNVFKTLPGYPAWPNKVSAPFTTRFIIINHWWLVGLSAILPVTWYAQYVRRRWPRLATPGLCAHCGYDLRASVDRCPECGRKIVKT
jgi:hypothetical protein